MGRSTDRRGDLPRRAFLRRLVMAAPVALLPVGWGGVLAGTDRRELTFRHTHTDETLTVAYWADGAYVPQALEQVNHLLRDFRNDEVHTIDPELLDILHRVAQETGSRGTYDVISGYRSPETNAKLRAKSKGVAKSSLHMQGRAIDVRLTDVATARLRDIALEVKLGGVGYYRKSDFVHLDTGRFRTW